MGKTYKRNQGYKKDRRDSGFKKSNKFKHWKDHPDHRTPRVGEVPESHFFPPNEFSEDRVQDA